MFDLNEFCKSCEGLSMNDKIQTLLNNKPTKEQIFNSVILSENYWKDSCKNQTELYNKQKKENEKLKPTYDMLYKEFNI